MCQNLKMCPKPSRYAQIIMLTFICLPLCPKLCQHDSPKPNHHHKQASIGPVEPWTGVLSSIASSANVSLALFGTGLHPKLEALNARELHA